MHSILVKETREDVALTADNRYTNAHQDVKLVESSYVCSSTHIGFLMSLDDYQTKGI